MGDWPIGGGASFDLLFADWFFSGEPGWPGSENTWGPWVELAASTAHRYTGLHITHTINGFAMLQLGVGASGSEDVIVDACDISRSGNAGGNYPSFTSFLPVHVPQGVRLALRIRRRDPTDYIDTSFLAERSTFVRNEAAGLVLPIGFDVANTDLTEASSGGGWVELTSAVERPLRGFVLQWFVDNGGASEGAQYVDIGVGAAGSEVAIVDSLLHELGGSINGIKSIYFPAAIPSGTRIAARNRDRSGGTYAINIGLLGIV